MTRKPNFGNLPDSYTRRDSSRVVIVPVPYDGTSTWIKGADRGPAALIEASTHLEPYDIETDSEVGRVGIFTDRPVTGMSTPEKMTATVYRRVQEHIADGKFTIVIGGEHSVSVGAVNAHAERFNGMSVLQLDAHTDLRPEYMGSTHNHGCVMAHVRKMCPIVQVGVRSMDSSEKKYLGKGRIFFAEDICAMKDETGWIRRAVSKLTGNVYVTIDLDAFDPSIMPSTGTPEPGGLGWYPVLRLLRTVAEERNIVGFDVVELCPNEHNKGPDFLAAKLIQKILSYKFELGTKRRK